MRFDDDAPTLGGQRLTGWELREVLVRLRAHHALLAVPMVVKLVRDACLDLAAKTEHCGVSPRNLFVTADGSMRLLDVCLTRRMRSDPRLHMATQAYLAPEQIDGGIIDQRTDIFAMGMVLYELLTGAPPLVRGTAGAMLASLRTAEIPPPVRYGVQLHPDVVNITRRMTQRSQELRYQTAAAVLHDVSTCLMALRTPTNADVADAVVGIMGISVMSRWVDDLAESRRQQTQRVPRRRKRQPAVNTVLAAAAVGMLGSGYLMWRAAPSTSVSSAAPMSQHAEAPPHADAIAAPALAALTSAPQRLESLATAAPQQPEPLAALPPPPRPAPRRHSASYEPKPQPANAPEVATGHLSLDAKPLANVYLGGRLLGATPLVARELPSGLTPLRLVDPVTGHERTVVIDIPSGGDVHRQVNTE